MQRTIQIRRKLSLDRRLTFSRVCLAPFKQRYGPGANLGVPRSLSLGRRFRPHDDVAVLSLQSASHLRGDLLNFASNAWPMRVGRVPFQTYELQVADHDHLNIVWRGVDGRSLSRGDDVKLRLGLSKHFRVSSFERPGARLPSLWSLFPNRLEKFHRW